MNDVYWDGFLNVLAETFEGAQQEWSYYLDQNVNAGLFATLNNFTARSASQPTPLGSSVAAHAEHVRFHLAATNAALRGETMALDWERSWDVQEVSEEAWRELRGALHDEYHELRRQVASREVWDVDEVGGAIAEVTHVAYHLAVIRQLAKFVRT
ncbi:hypothetical protein [Deinococcus yavapaiensis]|uniref:hypothetical protein n=1 Tax=Deinococcus yavapaiensis TaxID=309889 RepID=UPI0011B38989|nr:hypothetical protein [Deinococcus yavapaiensis]